MANNYKEIIVHLKYIKEKQAKHDSILDKLFDKFDEQLEIYNKRFGKIEKEISTAKGLAAGAMLSGGAGLLAGLSNFLSRLFR